MKSFRRVLTSRSLLRRRSETHADNQTLYSSRLLFSDSPSSSSSTTTTSSYVQSQNIFTSFNRSNSSSFSSTIWNPLRGQRRNIFIQTQSTPNPSSLMFYPGKPVMEIGSSDFPNARSAMTSPLAKAIYGVDGVTRVFFGSDFVTVTKSEDVSWDIVKPDIFAAIMDFYSSGEPLFLDSNASASKDTAIHE